MIILFDSSSSNLLCLGSKSLQRSVASLLFLIKMPNTVIRPVPVAERSKARVCGRSLSGIAGSNPAGGMDIFCECYVLSSRCLCDRPFPRPEAYYRLWLRDCV